MSKSTDKAKPYSVLMPKDLWIFLKTLSITTEESMSVIVLDCLYKFKKRIEAKNSTNSPVV